MNKMALAMCIAVYMTPGVSSAVCSQDPYPSKEHRRLSPGNTTYYIDPANGSDSNSGLTEKLPWRTFSHINGLRLSAGLLKSASHPAVAMISTPQGQSNESTRYPIQTATLTRPKRSASFSTAQNTSIFPDAAHASSITAR